MIKRLKSKISFLAIFLVLTSGITTPSNTLATPGNQMMELTSHPLVDGVTEAVYSYENAIKQTIYVESTLDSDRDGNPDRIAADIIRPAETEADLKVPVIMDASPYYESLGRGNESEIKDPDGDGINDMFPLYYDNYFVPRGYAVVQVDMVGTNNSDGCPTTGGFEEVESIKVVIEWLNGKGKAWDTDGNEIAADWSTGKVGMIGKSYDGTLANGVAATGVEGLETIVPIGAISSWYDYYRYGGIPFYNNGPGGLAGRVTSSERVQACAPVREELRRNSDDPTGDYNDFWDERNYFKDADKVNASVFVIHGLNDYNVKANHFSNWWEALAENDVPRKLWLTQTGHVDPFDFRRAEWVHTLHQWFDYWLLDIDNGIMDEPMVDIERAADEWETESGWPAAESKSVRVRLSSGTDQLPGGVVTSPVLDNQTQTFRDNPRQSDQQMVEDEFNSKENRLIFLSPELGQDVRLSGVPELNIEASIDKDDTHLTALIVDYGTDERVNHRDRGEGIRTLDVESCWGESSPVDDACYKETERTTHEAPYEIVTHGWMDAQNWESLSFSNPLEPGRAYNFRWDTLPEDYVFKEGHRIGIILAGSSNRWLLPDNNQAAVEVTLGKSYISLPIVGGKTALDEALGINGGTSPENAEAIQQIVQYYQDEEAFADATVSRVISNHLTALDRFEKQQDAVKVIKHLSTLSALLDQQFNGGLLEEEAYLVLKADTEYLMEQWQ